MYMKFPIQVNNEIVIRALKRPTFKQLLSLIDHKSFTSLIFIPEIFMGNNFPEFFHEIRNVEEQKFFFQVHESYQNEIGINVNFRD
ncbi:CLUMA_CG001934, isoform A [Clunio marinus]|uniref:CLUMA_CG001934, isoform A n=1 Tax=Clunio marinus TaxID=568069 RepID=A0A1J1HJF2_9DIPT|nr:CLUMA_CG001934, isoform A [Clunio marinus]